MERVQEVPVRHGKNTTIKMKGVCSTCGEFQFLLHDVEKLEPAEIPTPDRPTLRLVPNIITATPSNTQEWLAWRMRGIGGSDAPIIMNESPWSTRFELWARKTNRMLPLKITYPMRRGIKLEAVARERYEEITGVPMPKRCLQRTDYQFARASFDGLNMEQRQGVEIKCPGQKDHVLALENKIPQKYIWQCAHLCWVSGLDAIDYFSYNPRENFDGPKVAKVRFNRDLEMERKLIKEEEIFWEYILNDEPPPEMPPKLKDKLITKPSVFRIRRSR